MRFRQFLNQPVRVFNTDKKKWIYIFSSMIFASLFILIYTPFGLGTEMEKTTTSSFRIFSFVFAEMFAIGITLYFFQFKVLKYYPHKTMLLKKNINFFLLQMLGISILHNTIDTIMVYNFFPEEFISNQEPDDFIDHFIVAFVGENTPIDFILDCIISIIPQIFVLSYPFMGCMLFFNINDLKEEVIELESELSQFKTDYKTHENDHIPLKILDEKNQVEFLLNLNQLLALESNNQYVLIYYLDEDGCLAKQIIRTRLKKLITELEHTPTLQCHRSYAVNLLHVKQLKNIDKKCFLTFSETDLLKIPVSKTYLTQIKDKLTLTH